MGNPAAARVQDGAAVHGKPNPLTPDCSMAIAAVTCAASPRTPSSMYRSGVTAAG